MAKTNDADELVMLDSLALDSVDQGQEFHGSDYYMLALLGLILPVALLLWGWL